jgi:hypothetical protein
MRWRSGLMGFSLIVVLCLEMEVLDPLDPQTGQGLSPQPVSALHAQRAPAAARLFTDTQLTSAGSVSCSATSL